MGELKRSSDEIITRKKKQKTTQIYTAWKSELYSDPAVHQQLFCFRRETLKKVIKFYEEKCKC